MAHSKKPTIKTIAHEAGVSISTVSNVLNGNSEEMSADTWTRVQEVIKQFNYRPNQIARGLVTRRTATIGLILAEIETPLFLQALTNIERDTRAVGYNLLLNHARNVDEEHEALELLLEKQVEGIVFLSTSETKDETHLQELQKGQTPVVFMNRSTQHADFDQVNWDNASGVYEAVNYLAKLGHQRIAHLVGPNWRVGSRQRLHGYKLGLEANKIEFRQEYLQNGDFTGLPDSWRGSTRALLDLSEPPTAIIASDDMVAAVVIESLREAGLDVPGDISVVGIDDQPFLFFLSLTTVKLPIIEAGQHAVNMLIQRIAEPETPAGHIMLPCPLIIRKTTGPVRL
jgi:LacI family transcriptional regulator